MPRRDAHLSLIATQRTPKRAPPWERANPKPTHQKLTPAQKRFAQERARKAGRRYPNLVDNMAAAKRR